MAIVAVHLHWTTTLKTILRVKMNISVDSEYEKFSTHLCAENILLNYFSQTIFF
jgi:hypothetical protein